MGDIFDLIAPDQPDIMDELEIENTAVSRLKDMLSETLSKFDDTNKRKDKFKLSQELKALVKQEISKIKPVQNVIERTLEKQVIKNIPMDRAVPVIQKEIIKEKPIYKTIIKEDKRELVEEKEMVALRKKTDDLMNQIKDLKDHLQRMNEVIPMMGGSGVIGIPAPEGNENKVLTVKSGKATWQTSSGGGGGTSSDVYTPSNITTTRTYSGASYTMDTLANVLGSLIASLQGAGIIQ